MAKQFLLQAVQPGLLFPLRNRWNDFTNMPGITNWFTGYLLFSFH